jgi:hypothetical protein
MAEFLTTDEYSPRQRSIWYWRLAGGKQPTSRSASPKAGIMPDQRPTVAEAVTSFMVVFGNFPEIRARAENLIATLRQNPQWSPEEIEEVQRLIEERISPPGPQTT